MKRRKWLLLPLLGILMMLLCGCDRTDALSFYIDELPENTKASVLLCGSDEQWTDAAALRDSIRTEWHVFQEEPTGWAVFEDTKGCDARLQLLPANDPNPNADSVRKLCGEYRSCKLIFRNSIGETVQTSDEIPLILPDRFACAKLIFFHTADNTAQIDKMLPRTFCGLTVSGWVTVLFCITLFCLPVLLTVFFCGDLRKKRNTVWLAAALLSIPGLMYVGLYFLQRCLPYLNLSQIPLNPKDYCRLLILLPFAVILLLLWRKQKSESINTNGVSDESN